MMRKNAGYVIKFLVNAVPANQRSDAIMLLLTWRELCVGSIVMNSHSLLIRFLMTEHLAALVTMNSGAVRTT